MNKNWSCPKKQQARLDTIINQYRNHFGYSVVNQYWSMAGLCDKPGCEIDQLITSGLLKEEQFHGVEIVQDICAKNVEAYPQAHWYNDDFLRAMARTKKRGQFNPDIVNADLIQTAELGAKYVSQIMQLMDTGMLIANFVIRCRYYTLKDGGYVLEKLNEQSGFRAAMRSGWEFDEQYYQYPGTGNSNTTMGSFVFIRKPRLAVAA